ncbi:hypothetical protein M011DRAFT_485412 [Sporormia fimetaria CBS 119925]|uniref:Glycosyltransferase family 34 protein n=1 Tax=Sporormia fimetaria CBS 119925 TaxID=1340428 RepID=A0A6A6VDQ4_9PLEO|nr:hypothetical protein M011DRAFT_485412 [Sporormia fimetaria CBS 119925]
MSYPSPQKLITLCLALFLVAIFFVSAVQHSTPIKALKHTAQSAVTEICSGNEPVVVHHDPASAFPTAFKPIRFPITSPTYTDPTGRQWHLPSTPKWTQPLANEILIVDMDTRIPTGPNELWNTTTMNYNTLDASVDSQMVSAAFMNHFLYARIHGYDYRFIAAPHLPSHHDTWIKPFVLSSLLRSYRFVVFIDADATIQHLELPLEWLFNKWNITPRTSIAMPIDTEQILGEDRNASKDSRGKVALNTGFIVAQNLSLTFEMLDAWKTCTEGKRYPECGQWKENWSHEQRAFSEYIRYDFNPKGDNIVELPCDDAMGFPGIIEDHPHILANCSGQFVRHQTMAKERTKENASQALLQVMAQLTQRSLQMGREKYWVDGTEEGWWASLKKVVGGD